MQLRGISQVFGAPLALVAVMLGYSYLVHLGLFQAGHDRGRYSHRLIGQLLDGYSALPVVYEILIAVGLFLLLSFVGLMRNNQR
jgi:hypothetical protein